MSERNKMIGPQVFKKKPVEVEAMRLVGSWGDTAQVMDWLDREGYPHLVGDATKPETLRRADQSIDGLRPSRGIYIDPATGNLMIRTLEGDMRAEYGDWVIQGVLGEFTPVKRMFLRRRMRR